MLRLSMALSSDRAVRNPSRVLRVPGSIHRKNPDNLRPVRIVGWHPELSYHESHFNGLPRPVMPKPHRPTALLNSSKRATRYAQAALLGVCEELARVANGQKHRELFKAAARLGAFIGAGLLDRNEAADWLLAAILRAGEVKDERGAIKTIHDGIARGERDPIQVKT